MKVRRFRFIQVVHGIRGFVFDAESNTPLSGAVISVHGIEHNVTTYRDGDFFRILTPGIYNVTVQRLGYVTLTIDQSSLSLIFFPQISTRNQRRHSCW